jgi:Zn-finger nucleic acid-binding protein
MVTEARAILCPSCGGGLDPEARQCPQCGTPVATRRCGVCFGLNLVDARNCRRCGKHLPDEDPAHRKEALACAGCGAAMTPRKLDNTLFDDCDHCGGLWLCPRTIDAVRTHAETRSRMLPFDMLSSDGSWDGGAKKKERKKIAYRRCPLCSKMMNRTNYARRSGVIIDVCREHGSYFDRGELAALFRFIEDGGLEKIRRRDEEELRAKKRDVRRAAILGGSMDPRERISFHQPSELTGLDLLSLLTDLF